MHRLARLPHLGLRTLRAFVPVLAVPDDEFAAQYLDGELLDLYLGMDRRDRVHACEVARRMLRLEPRAEPWWVQGALLHDLGKSAAPFRAWERVLVHLWTPDAKTATRFSDRLQDTWQRHRRHPDLGAERLRQAGADPRLVALVAGHHRANADDRAGLLLQRADGGH